MKKTIITIILLAGIAISVFVQQYDPESDFKAELMEGGKSVRIAGYKGEKWTVRIPPKIQDIPVTHIGDEAFQETNISSVIIPNSVIDIDEGAFDLCRSLTNVTLGNGVTSIGNAAFSSCESLTAINVAPDNSTFTTFNGVLYNKDKSVLHIYPAGKKGNFIIPNGVTSIENWAFSGSLSLTGVTISNSVISIGDYAFENCASLDGHA